jgi:2-methylcitrate dehydratase PrpD
MFTKPTAKNGAGMPTNTHTSVAQAVHATSFADFSPTTIHKMKIYLRDTLGVSLAGTHTNETAL